MKEDETKNLHAGHRERLRQQFKAGAFNFMNEHQILELMLSYVIPQKDTNPLAHMLINKFGSLVGVLEAPYESLRQVKGVGHVVASFIFFQSKFIDFYKKSKATEQPYLQNTKQIIEFLKEIVSITDIEKFYYICLNSRGKLICFCEMGLGSTYKVQFDNKEFINNIINSKAHSVVICHTHPSGLPTPSAQDIKFTKTINLILDGLNVRLCDHIIISHEGYYSFFQNKLLGNEKSQTSFSTLRSALYDEGFKYSVDDDDRD